MVRIEKFVNQKKSEIFFLFFKNFNRKKTCYPHTHTAYMMTRFLFVDNQYSLMIAIINNNKNHSYHRHHQHQYCCCCWQPSSWSLLLTFSKFSFFFILFRSKKNFQDQARMRIDKLLQNEGNEKTKNYYYVVRFGKDLVAYFISFIQYDKKKL